MPGLGVNIDHVATIRQARRTIEPDPVWAAVEAQLGGADCITFHLRKDRRHINDRDSLLLKEVTKCKLNMEMSLDEEIVQLAIRLRPAQVTLVPENREEVTTEGGLDVLAHSARVAQVTRAMHDVGTIVSTFIEPIPAQIHASRDAGCDAVEIHTGAYANARMMEREQHLGEIAEGLRIGLTDGLIVHGGHGLTYDNIAPVAALRGFSEFNIGHSIVSRSVFVGMRQAVAEMKRLLELPQG